jgi:hypothetical protein
MTRDDNRVALILLKGIGQNGLDRRFDTRPGGVEPSVYEAVTALTERNHLNVEVAKPVPDRNTAPKGDYNQVICVVDRDKPSAVRGPNTATISTRQKLSKSAYSWNSVREVAPAAWTKGQLPAVQEMVVVEEGTLFSEQYAAAAYCS